MPDRHRARIPQPRSAPDLQPLKFSFAHLDSKHQKFSIKSCSGEFFHALFERLREYSAWTVEQFRDQNNKEHRHIIDFPATTEPDGFIHANIAGDPDQFRYEENAWQFGLHSKRDWRIHGILIDDIFYVVWLDQEHRLGGKRSNMKPYP